MHGHDGVPLLLGHRGKHTITVHARVVYHRMQSTKGFNRLSHSALTISVIRDIRIVGNRATTRCYDLTHYLLSGLLVDIVDNDTGTYRCQYARMRCAQTATGSGNNNHSVLTNSRHHEFLIYSFSKIVTLA